MQKALRNGSTTAGVRDAIVEFLLEQLREPLDTLLTVAPDVARMFFNFVFVDEEACFHTFEAGLHRGLTTEGERKRMLVRLWFDLSPEDRKAFVQRYALPYVEIIDGRAAA